MKLSNICTNCQIVTSDNGNKETIFSYGTPVLSVVFGPVDRSKPIPADELHYHLVRHWDGWSATTQRHINKAFEYTSWYPNSGKITKKEWDAMPVEEV